MFEVERFETVENEVLAGFLTKLKEVEKQANDYFETIKDFIATVNTPGHKSTPDEIRKKAEINYKDTLWQVERQELVDAMKPVVAGLFEGKLNEYEEIASVELDDSDEKIVHVKIINALEEWKKGYSEKNNIPSPFVA